jgi:TPR repeat protein
MSSENLILNSKGNSLHGESFQIIQNFNNTYIMSASEINKNIFPEKNYIIIINEIIDFVFKGVNIGNRTKQYFLDYLNNYNINSNEIYNWLLYNQNNPNFIFLLGYYNYFGIGTKDEERAFNLFINASEQDHILAQYYVGYCYEFGVGITKNEKLALEY